MKKCAILSLTSDPPELKSFDLWIAVQTGSVIPDLFWIDRCLFGREKVAPVCAVVRMGEPQTESARVGIIVIAIKKKVSHPKFILPARHRRRRSAITG